MDKATGFKKKLRNRFNKVFELKNAIVILGIAPPCLRKAHPPRGIFKILLLRGGLVIKFPDYEAHPGIISQLLIPTL